MLSRNPFPSLTNWNRPELQEAQTVAHSSSSYEHSGSNFLTSEHRDSWNPSWNGSCGGYGASSGNYDFFMA